MRLDVVPQRLTQPRQREGTKFTRIGILDGVDTGGAVAVMCVQELQVAYAEDGRGCFDDLSDTPARRMNGSRYTSESVAIPAAVCTQEMRESAVQPLDVIGVDQLVE